MGLHGTSGNALCLYGPGDLVQTSEAESRTRARRPLYALARQLGYAALPCTIQPSPSGLRIAVTKRLQSSTKAPGWRRRDAPFGLPGTSGSRRIGPTCSSLMVMRVVARASDADETEGVVPEVSER